MVHDEGSRFSEKLVPHIKRSANSQASISGRRMDKDALKRSFLKNPSIGYAVERHPSREANTSQSGILRQLPEHPEVNLFKASLKGRRNITMPLLKRLLRRARRAKP